MLHKTRITRNKAGQRSVKLHYANTLRSISGDTQKPHFPYFENSTSGRHHFNIPAIF